VRFRGLAKNTTHVVTLFALSNLWMARKQLVATAGVVRKQHEPRQTGESADQQDEIRHIARRRQLSPCFATPTEIQALKFRSCSDLP
jgi:hypothetical protein